MTSYSCVRVLICDAVISEASRSLLVPKSSFYIFPTFLMFIWKIQKIDMLICYQGFLKKTKTEIKL